MTISLSKSNKLLSLFGLVILFDFAFLLTLFINISFVKADCTNEEIAKLKDEAGKIKVTYEHLGEVTNDIGDVFYDRFNVEITNVGNDIILEINDLGEYSSDKDGKVKLELTTGDNIINSVILAFVSIICLSGIGIYFYKNKRS